MKSGISLAAVVIGFWAIAAPARAYDCAGTPPNAVMTLPEPLAAWGALVCTSSGHIITNKEGWIWTHPGGYAPVSFPSQMVQTVPSALGNKSYFTRIDMTKVDGDEFQMAFSAFHEGFAPDAEQPTAYRLELTSVSGQMLKVYFFDYNVRVWGISCPDKCDRSTRFMLLNLNKAPAARSK